MNSMTNRTKAAACASWAVPTLGLFAMLLLAVPAATRQIATYSHTYYGNLPNEGNPGWHAEAQGLDHDDSSWYITQNPTSSFPSEAFGARAPAKCSLNSRTGVWTCPNPRLWRSPASLSLGQGVTCGDPAAAGPETPVCTSLYAAAPFLWQLGYDHFGDIDYYKPEGQPGYVCVPLEGKLSDLPSLPGAFAFFRADDLSFVAWAVAPGMNAVSAWCAIDDSGHIYSGPRTPADFTGMVHKYELNWAGLALDVPTPELALVGTMALLDENGNSLSLSKYLQGGTFANANLLYLLNGQGGGECPDCGIHVFEVSHNTTGGPCGVTDGDCSARRVAQSTRGDGAFKYEFHPGWSRYEEPEGLTWWDLTAPNAPAAPGVTSSGLAVADTQLHAILLDNDALEDDVYVKHYRVEVPPMTGIAVDPSVVAFDRTDVGATKTETVRVSNHGSADLSLNALEIAGGGGMFTFASPIVPPIVLAPGARAEIGVRFTPATGGSAAATLSIASTDPVRPQVTIALSGEGISLVDQARMLLESFELGLAQGLLVPVGSGASAGRRAEAFRLMLVQGLTLLDRGDLAGACAQFKSAYLLIDGSNQPADLIAGSQAAALAAEIAELCAHLGCPVP